MIAASLDDGGEVRVEADAGGAVLEARLAEVLDLHGALGSAGAADRDPVDVQRAVDREVAVEVPRPVARSGDRMQRGQARGLGNRNDTDVAAGHAVDAG